MHDTTTLDGLVPSFYDHLRALARHRLQPGDDHSLNSTALLHEAYLRLAASSDVEFVDRDHFFAVASLVMRNVLVDHARARTSQKRGGLARRVPLHEEILASEVNLDAVLDLDEALRKLEGIDPRQCRIVECRYFGGLSLEETASALGVSLATVKRDLRLARAWLASELTPPSA